MNSMVQILKFGEEKTHQEFLKKIDVFIHIGRKEILEISNIRNNRN